LYKSSQYRKKEALSAVTYSAASSIIITVQIGTYQPERRAEDFIQCPWHFPKALERVEELDEEYLGSCCFGFDLRAMQHERLYTRLYIS